VVSSIRDIPLGKIRESKTNPRRFFDEAKLAELAFVITSITVALFFSAAALCQQTNASKQTAKKLDWEIQL
jgi:hypothetical protein